MMAHINYLLLIKIVIKTRIVNTSWKNDKETSCRRDKKIRSLDNNERIQKKLDTYPLYNID